MRNAPLYLSSSLTFDVTSRSPAGWPYWLGSTAIGICSAEIAFNLTAGPERYEQFAVGSMAWRIASKHGDYALLIGLLAGFAAAWLALLLTERRVEGRLGLRGVGELRALIAYASLPLVIWASGLVLGGSSTRELVWLSAAGVGLAGALMLAATMGAESDDPETTPGTAAGWVMLATVFGALSPLVAVLAANRLAIPATQSFLWTGSPSALVLAVLGGIAGLVLGFWAWRARPRGSQRPLRVMLVVAQLLLPWGFLVVMPTPWVAGEIAIYGGPVSAVPWLVFVLVAVAYVDVIRRLPALDRHTAARSLTHTLSPVAVAAALLFVKLPPISIQQLNPDDYHFGEYLLPWYSLTSHGAVPFWDYVPARGLINYLDSAVAAIDLRQLGGRGAHRSRRGVSARRDRQPGGHFVVDWRASGCCSLPDAAAPRAADAG